MSLTMLASIGSTNCWNSLTSACLKKKDLHNYEFIQICSNNKASLLDQIKMTKNWLEFEQNKFTPTNLNVRT